MPATLQEQATTQEADDQNVSGAMIWLTDQEQYLIGVLLQILCHKVNPTKGFNETAEALFHKFNVKRVERGEA